MQKILFILIGTFLIILAFIYTSNNTGENIEQENAHLEQSETVEARSDTTEITDLSTEEPIPAASGINDATDAIKDAVN